MNVTDEQIADIVALRDAAGAKNSCGCGQCTAAYETSASTQTDIILALDVERKALRAELAALKEQEPVACGWVNSSFEFYEIFSNKVCDEAIGLKPVPLYAQPKP
jgi:hypothetical protein